MSALNEKISAWFEPRTFDLMEHPSRVSPEGFWAYVGGKGWQPLDYLTDEAANARLLETMPRPALAKGANGDWCCHWHTEWTGKWEYEVIGHPDRKTAVVLAFCKFAGIEED